MAVQRWHTGAVVADINAAIADFRRFGPCLVSDVARLTSRKWDGDAGAFVEETVDVAWLRDGSGETFELIRPITATGPQARLLSVRAGPNHVAYWCDDPAATAGALLDDGAGIVLVTLADPAQADALAARGGPRALFAIAGAIYLRLPGGLIVEINARPAGLEPMVARWGDAMRRILPEVGHDR